MVIFATLLQLQLLQPSFAQETSINPTITEIKSENGVLETTIRLQEATVTLPSVDGRSFSLRTRLFNGDLPGPTFRLQPGDTMKVTFVNDLNDQGLSHINNCISSPDESNLHFHGLYISGELPSDDATLVVSPGQNYSYSTKLPENHMPGTHWMHPHRHGSTSLQVGGGAASAIIVEDPPGTLPMQLEGAPEIIFLAQQFDLRKLDEVAREANDELLSISTEGDFPRPFALINGRVRPTFTIEPGRWTRLRVIWAAWLRGTLNFSVPDCETQLIAKDGIYLRNPRPLISPAPIEIGGRADIMVRCMEPLTAYPILGVYGEMATLETTSGPVVDSSTLESWQPSFPDYLSNLIDKDPTPGCSSDFKFTERPSVGVNGIPYKPDDAPFQSFAGAIVERDLNARDHPYHQHSYPFQLIQGFEESDKDIDVSWYYQVGDWHDTISSRGVIRYQPNLYTGKMMIHCHQLIHEDEGMMTVEFIKPAGGKDCCVCSASAVYNAADTVADRILFLVFIVTALSTFILLE